MPYVGTASSYTISSDTTWGQWNVTTSSTTTTSNPVWITWNNGSTTTGTLIDSWVTWIDEHGQRRRALVDNGSGSGYNYGNYNTPAAPPTEEELERRRIQQEAWQRQDAERKAEKEKAEQTAQQLLHSLLDEEQRESLQKNGFFYVVGSKSGKKYKLKTGYAGNVEVAEGNRTRRYCAHPRESLPTHDHMIAQFLTLTHDEDRFLAVANVS